MRVRKSQEEKWAQVTGYWMLGIGRWTWTLDAGQSNPLALRE
jgi:hypothetical protein